jgi:hypothetical protein
MSVQQQGTREFPWWVPSVGYYPLASDLEKLALDVSGEGSRFPALAKPAAYSAEAAASAAKAGSAGEARSDKIMSKENARQFSVSV